MDSEIINSDAQTAPEMTSMPEEAQNVSPNKSIFARLTQHPYAYLALCFFVPTLIMYLLYLVRGLYPIGDESVLVLDLNGQYVYFYEALRNAVLGKENLLYSFSRQLGGEFLGIYAYYLASPLSYLVVLFPQGRILEALLVIFLIKTGLCGTTFGYYLHKTTVRPRPVTVILFSTMYALSSYAVVQQHNSMWIDALIWLPILTLSIEALIKERKYKLFVISLAMTVMSNFYIGYMVCIYVALYFFYYYLAKSKNKENNPLGERAHFLLSLVRIGLSSALAIGMSAVIVLSAYYSLSFGKNTFSDPDWSFILRYDLADLFVKLLPGAYDTVRPEGLPILYCGTLTLLLLPFYYLSKKIPLREKVFTTLLVGVFIASFIINPLDLVWHGFQKPNWLNYRYSFMVCFLLLVMAYKAMQAIVHIRSTYVLAAGGVLALAVVILSKFDYENFVLDGKYGFTEGKLDPLRTVAFTLLMLFIYCVAIYALRHAPSRAAAKRVSIILAMIVCLEMFGNGVIQMSSLDYDVVYSTYSSYNDYISKARQAVKKVEALDSSFYRMEKTTHRRLNDSMALGMRGLSGSTSTLNKETIEFLQSMGYSSKSHWSKYLGGNPVSDSLLGIKYVMSQKNLSKSDSNYNETMAYEDALSLVGEVLCQTSYYTVYENPYALSLAYAVSDAIYDFAFTDTDEDGDRVYRNESPFDRLNALVTTLVGAEETVELFVPIPVESSYTNGRKSAVAGHTKYTFYDSDHSVPVYLLFSVAMPKDALLYFYAPSQYPRETDLTVNDEVWGEFMTNDSNRIKALGYRETGEWVTAKMTLDDENFYLKNDENIFYYLDLDVFENVMQTLAKQQFQIQEYTESRFYGSIMLEEKFSTILTTLAYDEGWQVNVDGKPVEIKKTLEGVIAFDVKGAGYHTLEFKYAPRMVRLGALISSVSAGLFLLTLLIDPITRLIQRKKQRHSSL